MDQDWSKHFRTTPLDIRDRVDSALASDDRNQVLVSLVHQLSAHGCTKQQLYDVFLNEHLRLRMEMREAEEELIADLVLDGLSGWGSGPRLLPDEPDAK